jgi:hypothetical protein
MIWYDRNVFDLDLLENKSKKIRPYTQRLVNWNDRISPNLFGWQSLSITLRILLQSPNVPYYFLTDNLYYLLKKI